MIRDSYIAFAYGAKSVAAKTGRARTRSRMNVQHRPQTLPEKFKVGFLATLDGRTDLAKALRANHDAIVADIGGAVEIGHVKSALIERFVWLEAILQTIESEMAQGQIGKAEALGRWIQAVNSLAGLAKVLGVERKARSMPWASIIQNDGNAKNGQHHDDENS